MKNTLIDLNNHLFIQLERLNEENIPMEKLELECRRTDSLVKVADNIVSNANLVFRAIQYGHTCDFNGETMPEMLDMTRSKKRISQ